MKSEGVYTLQQTLQYLQKGDIVAAKEHLDAVLAQNCGDSEAEYAFAGLHYWTSRLERVSSDMTAFEKAESLLSEWEPFLKYMAKHGVFHEQIIYSIKCAVFIQALLLYETLLRDKEAQNNAELCRKIGRCYKTIGEYDRAFFYLLKARDADPDSAATLADLADCYALCGEIRSAKVYFREAFFKGPERVETQFLESDLICRLILEVKKRGYDAVSIPYWVAVFGVLHGVFDVKRELRAVEFGQLKQTIYLLETELNLRSSAKKTWLIPRLLNCYFWLIDHYINVDADKGTIDKVLLKIKLHDENIYTAYIG